jgi:hypothetical protein
MKFYQILRKRSYTMRLAQWEIILMKKPFKLLINIIGHYTRKFKNKIFKISRKNIDLEICKKKTYFNSTIIMKEI